MPEMSMLPVPNQQFLDDNGDPLAGGKLYFYQPGTTTDKTVYSDSEGLTPLSNPVILDSAGRAAVWINGYYKIKVDNSDDVEQYTEDNISGQYYQVSSNIQWTLQDDALTYISGTQFSVLTDKTATYEIGRRVKATVTAGTIYGTVSASSVAGDPAVTTVTVVWDSGSLDSGLSAVSLGILTITNSSIPIYSTQSKTANYTMTIADINKKIIPSANSEAITMLTANAVPNGFSFGVFNAGANQIELTGTVNGFANVTFLQYEGAEIFSDNSNWYSFNMHNQDAVGTVKSWHKSMTGIPQILPWGWVECDGTLISDGESPANGQTLPDLNNNGRFIRGSNTSGNTQANQNLEHTHSSNTSIADSNTQADVSQLRRGIGLETVVRYVGEGAGNESGLVFAANRTLGGISNKLGMYKWSDLAVTEGIANEGGNESRPDNISMVYIMKIK